MVVLASGFTEWLAGLIVLAGVVVLLAIVYRIPRILRALFGKPTVKRPPVDAGEVAKLERQMLESVEERAAPERIPAAPVAAVPPSPLPKLSPPTRAPTEPSDDDWRAGALEKLAKQWHSDNPRSREGAVVQMLIGLGGGALCAGFAWFVHAIGMVACIQVPLIIACPILIIYGLYRGLTVLGKQVTITCPLCGEERQLLTAYTECMCPRCLTMIRLVGDPSKARSQAVSCPHCASVLALYVDAGSVRCFSCGTRLTVQGSSASLISPVQNCSQAESS